VIGKYYKMISSRAATYISSESILYLIEYNQIAYSLHAGNIERSERRSNRYKSESGIKRQVILPFTTWRPESHCWKISKLETRPLISYPNSKACTIARDSRVLSSNIPAIRPPLTNLTALPPSFAHSNPHSLSSYRLPIRGDRLLAQGLSISYYQYE